jgi:fibronectin-binding autotransporter adhesin
MRLSCEKAAISNSRVQNIRKQRQGRRSLLLMLAAAPVALAISSQTGMAAIETWTGTNGAEWGTSGNWTGTNPTPATGDVLSFTSAGSVLTSDDNLGNAYSLGGLNFNTGAGAYNLTSNLGANNQTLTLTGPLIDNGANSTTQTVNFGVSSTSGLILGSDLSAGNVLALNASSTFSYFNVSTMVQSATPTADALVIAPGATVTINGAATFGQQSSGAGSNSSFNTYAGSSGIQGSGGILTVNGTMTVGGANTNSTSTKDNTTADLEALSGFNLNAPSGALNIGYGQNVKGILVLASGAGSANVINVGTIDMGTSAIGPVGSSENGQTGSELFLGTGTNVIEANTINLGSGKSTGAIAFQYSAGSVSISGTNGTGASTITLGNENVSSATAATSSLLLAGHTATVQAGAVIVGEEINLTSATTMATAVATFDTGTFNAVSISIADVLGNYSATTGGDTASFTLGTSNVSTGILNVSGALTLGTNTNANSSNGGISNASLIINGGTANLSNGISVPSTAPHGTTNSTLQLSGGTLNLGGFGVAGAISAGTLNMTVILPTSGQTATIMNLGGNGIYATNGTGSTSGGGGLVMGGSGTLILAGTNNSYSGATTINSGGTLQIGSGALGGSVPAGSSFTNNGIVNFAGSAPISISNSISGSGLVNHNSTGTTTLSGSNTYNGATTINSGVLAVTGSLLSSGAVNISGGILAGTGSVGNVTLYSGAIHPGVSAADGNFGTLAVNSLVDVSGDMRFDIGGSASDVINDAGVANFSPGTTISLALDSAPASNPDSYTIFTAAGGFIGLPALTTTLIGRTSFSLSNTSNTLVITSSGNPANLIWGKLAGATGDGVTWDSIQDNQNWTLSGSANTFYNDDNVTFNDNNNGHTTVTISGQVTPGSVTFSNSATNYTVNGTGGIYGPTGLLVSGTGSVTLLTANGFTGDTNINSGTLILGTGGSISDTNVNVNGGTLNVSGGVLGSTNLNITTGAGIVASGSVSSPNINISGGSLTVGSTGSLTGNGVAITVGSGAAFTLAAGGTLPATTAFVDNGTAAFAGSGATIATLNGAGTAILSGDILTVTGGGSFGGTLQDGTSPGSLNVTGGTLTLSGSNTYSGPTTVAAAGVLQVGNGGSTGSLNSNSAITNAGTLTYNLSSPSTIANSIANSGNLIFNSAGNLTVISTITGAGQLMQMGAGNTSLSGSLSGFTGSINMGGGTLTFNYSSPSSFANPITVSGVSTIQNVGKLTLSGTQTYAVPTITYDVSSVAGTMPDGVPADVELTGSLDRSIGDGVDIIKTGPGTLALSGSSDNVSLGVTVNQGTLLLNKSSSSAAHAIGGGGLTINSGGIARITGTGGDQIYNGAGTVAVNDGGLFDMNAQNEQVFNLTLGNSTNGSGGTLANNVAGSSSVMIVGMAANGSTAATGVFKLAGNANIFAASGATLELQVNGAGAGSGATNTLTANGPGTVLLTGTTDDTNVGLNVASGTVVLAKNSSTGIHAASSVVGVSPGAILQLGGTGGDQIYDGFNNTANWGVFNMDGTFDLNGNSEGFDKLTGTGNVINSQSGTQSVLTLGTDSFVGTTPATFAGTISGNIALNKVIATGGIPPQVPIPLTLTGSNSYTGTTTITTGLLQIGGGGSTGTLGSGPVVDNDTLDFNRSDAALAVPNAVSGSGTVNQVGVGATTLSGTNSYTGGTNVNAGTLKIASAGAFPPATSLTVAGGASLVAVQMTPATALQVSSLNNSGLIDLNNNGLDVSGSSLSTIWSQLQSGYNGGGWNGTSGIISTTAATNTTHLTALGVILNDNGSGTPLYGSGGLIASTFEGVTPSDGDVLVKYTYYGDTNLDGKVDGTDYARIDNGYLQQSDRLVQRRFQLRRGRRRLRLHADRQLLQHPGRTTFGRGNQPDRPDRGGQFRCP